MADATLDHAPGAAARGSTPGSGQWENPAAPLLQGPAAPRPARGPPDRPAGPAPSLQPGARPPRRAIHRPIHRYTGGRGGEFMTTVSMPFRAGASLRARLVPLAAALALAAFVAAPGFACTTCDTNNKCHSGDEQGGYLCRVSEVHCGFLSQLFGAECQQKTLRNHACHATTESRPRARRRARKPTSRAAAAPGRLLRTGPPLPRPARWSDVSERRRSPRPTASLRRMAPGAGRWGDLCDGRTGRGCADRSPNASRSRRNRCGD